MNKATNLILEQAADFLLSRDYFLILSHTSPDGDTCGCAHALCGALQRLGKHAKIKCADPLAKNLMYLKNAIAEENFEEQTIVSVDIADKKLLGDLEEEYGDKIELAIDHHVSHVPFAKRIFVDDTAAAACEIVFFLIKLLGVQLDEALAACLYTGIATDTGCFRYGNTTAKTHKIAAELMGYGFDYSGLNYVLFDMKSKSRVKFEQSALAGMEFFADDKGAYIILTKEMLDKVDSEDVNGVASLPRLIEGVEVGIVFKQKDDGWKMSMRSNTYVNVQEICGKFGGGGHVRASGCFVKGTIDEVKAAVLPVAAAAINGD